MSHGPKKTVIFSSAGRVRPMPWKHRDRPANQKDSLEANITRKYKEDHGDHMFISFHQVSISRGHKQDKCTSEVNAPTYPWHVCKHTYMHRKAHLIVKQQTWGNLFRVYSSQSTFFRFNYQRLTLFVFGLLQVDNTVTPAKKRWGVLRSDINLVNRP